MTYPITRKVFFLVACLTAVAFLRAEEKPAKTGKKNSAANFVRIRRDAQENPLALETAIVRYLPRQRGKKSHWVDLIAAVHIADKDYYERINKEFKNYDVVLYEMVAPKGTRISPESVKKSRSVVSMVQRGMKNLLELEFQLDAVDYNAKNLVHADMSPEQFSRSMADRNESFWTYFSRLMQYSLSQQSAGKHANDDAKTLAALFSKDRALVLKRIMAEQFADMGGTITALEGPKGSTILSGRNLVALGELRKQLGAGKRKIAIFYGGAHMPDFDRRLRADFDLRPAGTRWLMAWDLKEKPKPPAPPKEPKSKSPPPQTKTVPPKAAPLSAEKN
ncbi:MAG: hypothetical protein JXB10_19055 [Pirellulales bacterium]|nr:hypothetical protein [Pirellulales bacterium]